jgi:hypothetical protein
MDLHAIEEAFDNDNRLSRRVMYIEQLKRFVKTRCQLITRVAAVDRAACIRDLLSPSIVNRNHDPAVHRTFSSKIADAERLGRLFADAALGEIRMR